MRGNSYVVQRTVAAPAEQGGSHENKHILRSLYRALVDRNINFTLTNSTANWKRWWNRCTYGVQLKLSTSPPCCSASLPATRHYLDGLHFDASSLTRETAPAPFDALYAMDDSICSFSHNLTRINMSRIWAANTTLCGAKICSLIFSIGILRASCAHRKGSVSRLMAEANSQFGPPTTVSLNSR